MPLACLKTQRQAHSNHEATTPALYSHPTKHHMEGFPYQEGFHRIVYDLP